jgi:hypothetical protein
MAEALPLAEIELQILLMPPISGGAHLGGPTLHAERLVALWAVDDGDDVPLSDAFRLLDVPSVAGVLLRATVERGDARYWPFPSLMELLAPLREVAWQEILAGRLVVVPRGRRALPAAELPGFVPDWQHSLLTRPRADRVYAGVRVGRLPPAAEPQPKLSLKEIKDALSEILKAEPTLFGEKLENALRAKGTTREKARKAIKAWAKDTVRARGEKTRKSPE